MATPGTILAGRYRLGAVIGRGGMSTVYQAEDTTLGRTVAVKVMLAALAERDPVSVVRFQREARAAASLSDPGIATVYDTGVEGGMRYIVMELAPGRSLQDLLHDEAPLSPARAVSIAAQVAETLSVAHAAGIIHRDIKPGNIMVAPNGSVKVLDFGIARADGGTTLTQAQSVVGTVAFMSPEQALGQPTDARSDIYSLGCVIYAMLAARPPFTAEVTAAVLHQHTSMPARPLRQVASNVPPALEALVMQMLAKDPDDRPQTASEVHDRLRATLDPTAATMALPASVPPAATERTRIAPLAAAAPSAAPTQSRPRRAAAPPPRRRGSPGRGLAIAALLLLLLVAGVVAAVALSSGGSSNGPTISHTQTNAPTTSTPHTTTPTTTPTTSSSTSTPSTSSTTTTTSTTTTPPTTGTTTTPPGHGGVPPGQAKKSAVGQAVQGVLAH